MSKKIKVLFRHRSMEMGGVEKVILSMLNNLDKEKFDTTMLLNLFQGGLRNEIPKHVRFVKLTKGKEDFSKNYIEKFIKANPKAAGWKDWAEKFREQYKILGCEVE